MYEKIKEEKVERSEPIFDKGRECDWSESTADKRCCHLV